MAKRLNTILFSERSNILHNSKYDYSLVDYVNNKTPVRIICPTHGIFEQLPIHHLNMYCGCPLCNKSNKSSLDEFIEKSVKIHNNKYDYSKVIYVKSKLKVDIICPTHGIFKQTPNSHVAGSGCIKCSHENKRLDYLSKFKESHGDKYDYSLIEFPIVYDSKVDIICPTHGVFNKIVYAHADGSGCNKCAGIINDIDTFKYYCSIKHNNKYDYTLVNYQNEYSDIICPTHGVFSQRLSSHIEGYGCNKCSIDGKLVTKKEFIERSNKVHNNKYDYSLVDYINRLDKVSIICPAHGIFNQTPKNHMSGYGCQRCNESKGELQIQLLLDKLNISYIRQHKFDDCFYKSNLLFDFYIPEYNMCIEYNGIQHYEPVEFFGGVKSFEVNLIRDSIKESYCNENDIKLIVIPYSEEIEDKILDLFTNRLK